MPTPSGNAHYAPLKCDWIPVAFDLAVEDVVGVVAQPANVPEQGPVREPYGGHHSRGCGPATITTLQTEALAEWGIAQARVEDGWVS